MIEAFLTYNKKKLMLLFELVDAGEKYCIYKKL